MRKKKISWAGGPVSQKRRGSSRNAKPYERKEENVDTNSARVVDLSRAEKDDNIPKAWKSDNKTVEISKGNMDVRRQNLELMEDGADSIRRTETIDNNMATRQLAYLHEEEARGSITTAVTREKSCSKSESEGELIESTEMESESNRSRSSEISVVNK